MSNNKTQNATEKSTDSQKATEAAKPTNATAIPEKDMPNVSIAANAQSMEDMQKQMNEIKRAMATQTAVEVKGLLDMAIEAKSKSTVVEIPTPAGHYLTAKLSSAMFMALRDELLTSHMRCEKSHKDKIILQSRMDKDEFRSDTEREGARKTLAYYETLDEKLQETIDLIADVHHMYDVAIKALHDEDDARQQDIPVDERSYTPMQPIRWVSAADQAADKSWEHINDMERLTKQAIFWIQYNSN